MFKLDDFRQETMYGPLGPLLRLGYFIGAIPFPLSTIDLSPLQKLFRLIQVLYQSVLILGLIASVVVLRLYTKEFDDSEHAPPFIKLFLILEHVLDTFVVIVICYGEQYMRISYKHLLDQLDDLLQRFGHKAEQILYRRMLFSVVAILAHFAVQIFSVWSIMEAVQTIRVVPLLVTVHVPLTLTIVFVQTYCLVVTTIAKMIGEINKKLEILVKQFNDPFNQEKPPYREISELRRTHLQIVDLLEQVNNANGILIISILTSIFANMNSHSLFLYNSIKGGEKPSNMVGFIIDILLMMLLRVLKVLAVIVPNSWVKMENQKTAKTLCKFEDSEKVNFNWVVIRYLQQLNELKDAHSACGMIQLESPLFVTMIGAVVTYMIILIQFNDNSSPLEKSTQTSLNPDGN